jgi:hypothetical protein
MKINPHDYAFPVPSDYVGCGGLSIREYFAAIAMQGMIQQMQHIDGYGDDVECARLSVQYADALINQLNQTNEL